jgi:hypothetical protein
MEQPLGVPDPEEQARNRRATRILLAAVGCFLLCPVLAIGLAIVVPVFAQARAAAAQVACLQRAKSVGKAVAMYASEHGGALPAAEGWREAVAPYLGGSSDFGCRYGSAGGPPDTWFHFNTEHAGRRLDDLPGDAVVVFQSDSDDPPFATRFEEPALDPSDYSRGYVVVRADGSAKVVRYKPVP